MIVVDASITLAWSIPQEQDALALKALGYVEHTGAVAPVLWRYEVANLLSTLRRRKEITPDDCDTISSALEALRIRLIPPDDARWMSTVTAVAEQFALTAYDAAYLALARSLALPLVS